MFDIPKEINLIDSRMIAHLVDYKCKYVSLSKK